MCVLQSNDEENIEAINLMDNLDYEDLSLEDDICYINEHILYDVYFIYLSRQR